MYRCTVNKCKNIMLFIFILICVVGGNYVCVNVMCTVSIVVMWYTERSLFGIFFSFYVWCEISVVFFF